MSKVGFSNISGVPNVIGVVDGTHILLRPPAGTEEPLYVCRKGGHSINVQVVCDSTMKITNIVAKHAGSTHDSYIWRNCGLRENFVQSPPTGWLLGDSGYAVEPWLLTPLENPITIQEKNYNTRFKKTRYIVENCIGLWKSVFRCIDKSGGILLYTPIKVCKIIIATAVLHNIRRDLRIYEDETYEVEEMEADSITRNLEQNAITVQGHQVRRNLINSGHFG